MGLLVGKCTNCAGKIEFDESLKKGFCIHCGTQFIAEEVINHITNNTTQNITIENAVIKMGATEQSLLTRAKQFMREYSTSSAKEYANKVLDLNPENQEAKDIIKLNLHYKVKFVLQKGGFFASNKFETHCKDGVIGKSDYFGGDLRLTEYDGKLITLRPLIPGDPVEIKFFEPGKHQVQLVDAVKSGNAYTIFLVEFEITEKGDHEIVLQNKKGQMDIISHNCKNITISKRIYKICS